MSATWYLAFTDYDGPHRLLRHCLKPGFGHVFAFAQADGFVQLVEPSTRGLALRILHHSEGLDAAAVAQILLADAHAAGRRLRVVRITLPLPEHPVFSHFANWLPTCVTWVKVLIGLRGPQLTPHGLYRALLAQGGEEIVFNPTKGDYNHGRRRLD